MKIIALTWVTTVTIILLSSWAQAAVTTVSRRPLVTVEFPAAAVLMDTDLPNTKGASIGQHGYVVSMTRQERLVNVADPVVAKVVLKLALNEAGCDMSTARNVMFQGRATAHGWCPAGYYVVGYHGDRHQVTAMTNDPGPAGEEFLTSVKVDGKPFFGPVAIPPLEPTARPEPARAHPVSTSRPPPPAIKRPLPLDALTAVITWALCCMVVFGMLYACMEIRSMFAAKHWRKPELDAQIRQVIGLSLIVAGAVAPFAGEGMGWCLLVTYAGFVLAVEHRSWLVRFGGSFVLSVAAMVLLSAWL